jgi:hypothetical protein
VFIRMATTRRKLELISRRKVFILLPFIMRWTLLHRTRCRTTWITVLGRNPWHRQTCAKHPIPPNQRDPSSMTHGRTSDPTSNREAILPLPVGTYLLC